jgi:hypothetical protein
MLRRRMRVREWGAVLAVVAVVGCRPRTPPPGSGAVETTPSASSAPASAQARAMPRTVVGFPGGAVLDVDPARCELRVIDDHGPRWVRELPGCRGVLSATIASDSTVYVRTRDSLRQFSFEGDQRWSVPVSEVDREIAHPTTLRDSRPVLATSPREITVFSSTGNPAWRFALPAGEVLGAGPSGLAMEGVVLASRNAVYVVGSNGQLHFRVAANP